ncbi:MAG TPA: DUF433 domain-containing protein [Candidatus Tectomicrobia bacterium]
MRRDQILTWDNDILGGIPVVTGTRVPVDTLMAPEGGRSLGEVPRGFP